MGFSNFTLEAANKLRPILLKVLPAELLRNIKSKIVQRNTESLKNIKIQPFDADKYLPGVNLVGNIRGDNGLGQSTRLIANILTESDRDFTVYNYYVPPGTSMSDTTYDDKISEELPYNVNIIHVNASEFTIAYMSMGKKLWNYRYNIAYWLWELEDFPEEWIANMNLADEIWTPAEFISRTLRKLTDKPVNTVPYCVTAPTDSEFGRDYFGLPKDKFLFLMMFDSGSIMERKNPLGTIEAFKRAFKKENKDVGIVIKINELEPRDIELIYSILDGYDTIYIISKTLTKVQVNSLTKCVDVFVSLHRAEGFGLVLAEAMLVGTPTIATNWSANTEFMNRDIACMVDYKMIEIEKDMPPFKKGYQWADADIDQAAHYMKKLFQDKEFYDKMVIDAGNYVREKLSMKKAVSIMQNRLNEIMDSQK